MTIESIKQRDVPGATSIHANPSTTTPLQPADTTAAYTAPMQLQQDPNKLRQLTTPYPSQSSERTTTKYRRKNGNLYCTQAATTAFEMLSNVCGRGDYKRTPTQSRRPIIHPGSYRYEISYDSLQNTARTGQARGLQQDPDASTATYTTPRQLQRD